MSTGTVKVEIPSDVFQVAQRTAALDSVDVPTLLEGLIRRHAQYVEAFEGAVRSVPVFSLDAYEMQRDPDETDERYEARLSLFR